MVTQHIFTVLIWAVFIGPAAPSQIKECDTSDWYPWDCTSCCKPVHQPNDAYRGKTIYCRNITDPTQYVAHCQSLGFNVQVGKGGSCTSNCPAASCPTTAIPTHVRTGGTNGHASPHRSTQSSVDPTMHRTTDMSSNLQTGGQPRTRETTKSHGNNDTSLRTPLTTPLPTPLATVKGDNHMTTLKGDNHRVSSTTSTLTWNSNQGQTGVNNQNPSNGTGLLLDKTDSGGEDTDDDVEILYWVVPIAAVFLVALCVLSYIAYRKYRQSRLNGKVQDSSRKPTETERKTV